MLPFDLWFLLYASLASKRRRTWVPFAPIKWVRNFLFASSALLIVILRDNLILDWISLNCVKICTTVIKNSLEILS